MNSLKIIQDASVILHSFRSACYLALEHYSKAEADAKKSIELDPNMTKGYYRLATSFHKRGLVHDAAYFIDQALNLEPSNSACLKLKQDCGGQVKETAPTSKAALSSGFLLGSSLKHNGEVQATCAGECCTMDASIAEFCNVCEDVSTKKKPRQKPRKKTAKLSTPREKQQTTSTGSETQYSTVEFKMLEHLKKMIKNIRLGDFRSAAVDEHMLQGMFKQLMEPKTFVDLLFPGAPVDVLELLPKNLKELFHWEQLKLDHPKIAKSAAAVLEGIRRKGAARGDVLDSVTEAVLTPQIVQEALAREVVDAVRKLSKLLSSVNARMSLSVARIPSKVGPATPAGTQADDSEDADDMSLYDMLDGGLCEQLLEGHVALQEQYLGEEWAFLIAQDAVR